MRTLGKWYADGRGVDKDEAKTSEWNQEALDMLKKILINTEPIPEMNDTIKGMDNKLDIIMSKLESTINCLKEEYALERVSEENLETKCIEFIEKSMDKIDSALNGSRSYDDEKEHLQQLFGDYWGMLDKYTKNSLISAKVLYTNCVKPSYKGLDYSGIVISASSALENELKLRFFTGYQKYLFQNYGNPKRPEWPESMLYEKNGVISNEKSFGIGSMNYIFNKITTSDGEKLKAYLDTIIDKNITKDSISIFTKGDGIKKSIIDRCEGVRKNYRNRAGHTEPVGKEMAENCCNTICDAILTSQKLDEIQGLLLDIVKVTCNFKVLDVNINS